MDRIPRRHLPLSPAERRLATRNLKRCPLCESVNSRRNAECFVCGWRGQFDEDPVAIEQGLIRLLVNLDDLGI